MLASEVLDLALWIEENFSIGGLTKRYTDLIGKINANMNAQRNRNAPQPFETEREALRGSMLAVDDKTLSEAQLSLLKKVGVDGGFGERGAIQLRDILVDNVIDLSTAVNRITELHNGVKKHWNGRPIRRWLWVIVLTIRMIAISLDRLIH